MKKRNTVLAVLLSASFLLTACQNTTEPAAENPAANTNSDTVSYTHLDVYKRQLVAPIALHSAFPYSRAIPDAS